VRITPFELHVEDSDYWEELYSRTIKQDKYEWMAGRFGANTMTFTTAKADLHALRRAPLNHMFSKRSILRFEPVIQEKVETMCDGIRVLSEKGEPIVLSDAYSAFAGDVIAQYCFGFSYRHLESPGFEDNFHSAFMAVCSFGHLALQYPMMHPVKFYSVSMTLMRDAKLLLADHECLS
jgi:cytochrome P450